MKRRHLTAGFKYLFLCIAALLSIFPLLWMFVSATNSSVDVITGRILPGTHLLENLRELHATTSITRALWNSFRNASVATIASLFVCSIAGYGFEIYNDRRSEERRVG